VTTLDRVRAVLADNDDGVVLESAGAVSWFLGGARVSVPLGGTSIAAVLVTRDDVIVRCHVMEAPRLAAEDGVKELTEVAWTEPLVPDTWRRDPRIRAEGDLELRLREARASLSGLEIERYRALGAEVAAGVTAVAGSIRPELSEQRVAGDLARMVYSVGAEPVVLLVAGRMRLGLRHPLPTDAPLGARAMLVVGARRHGLIVNLTRWVQFDADEPDAARRIRAVEADVLDATVPGVPLRDVFASLRRSYRAHGFDEDEWRRHHQGGPTGYFGRDPKVTPHTTGIVAERQAYSWNPSAAGAKSEDTVLITSAGVELLTHDPAWPNTLVAGRPRPVPMTP